MRLLSLIGLFVPIAFLVGLALSSYYQVNVSPLWLIFGILFVSTVGVLSAISSYK